MLLLFLTVTSEDVCRNIRNVKLNEFLFSNMRFIVMFVTAVCVLFLTKIIGHFTVVYSVTRPMNDSEAAGDLELMQTSLFFCFFFHLNRVVVMLTSLHLHKESKEVCIKTRSPVASLPFIGRVTEPQL